MHSIDTGCGAGMIRGVGWLLYKITKGRVWKLFKKMLIDSGYQELVDGDFVIEDGKYFTAASPTITQSGGELWTYGSSTPTITQSGGVLRTCGSSTPTITQSGGTRGPATD